MDVQLLDVPSSPQLPAASASPHSGLLIPIEDISGPVANSSPIVSRLTPPTPPGPDVANTSQPDLITFDSFSAAHDDDDPTTTEAHDHELLPAQPSTATVDDLLSMSPNPPPTASATPQPNILDPPPSEGLSDNTEPEDEMEVANSLIIEADSPWQPTTDTELAQPDQGDAQDTVIEATQVPLRRSARPRRSRNSLPQTVATPPPPPPVPSPPLVQAVEINMATEDDPQERPEPSPFRKRKLKVVPPLDANIAASSGATYATTPKKTPQAALARRELGSLSPMSSAVLTQLLPKPAGDSASRSNTPQPPETDTGPSEPAPPPAPSTPPPHAINLVFPKVGAVDGTATDIQRPKSPLRPFPASPFKPDEARTPARRVPISQAIADGTYSTQKIPALFSASRPTAVPGTPVFRRTALDDPLRSPARRVPMSEAVPMPPASPDKGKNVFRPLSPMRMASRERQRSGSAEPKPQLGRKERGSSAEPTTRPPALGRRPVFQKPASTEGVASGSSLLKPRTALPFPLGQSQRLHPAIPETDEPGPSAVRPPAAVPCASAHTVSPAKGVLSLRQPSAGSGSKIPRIGTKPYGRPKVPSKLPAPTKSGTARKVCFSNDLILFAC